FSGIGGFSLGLERTGGFETVAFCEIEPFPRKVLAKHWPKVPIYDDVSTAEFVEPVDLVTAGFPCQDISFAGEGAGLAGSRSGLFWHVLRAVCLVGRPKLLLENVAALLARGMGTVLGALAQIGYDTEWHCIPASYVGLPHSRDRIWIVADPDCPGLERRSLARSPDSEWQERAEQLGAMASTLARVSAPSGTTGGIAYGVSDRMDRTKALGNAVVPQIPELLGNAMLASMTHTTPQPGRDR